MMGKLLGVEFAPLNVPFERRLQTLAVTQWVLSFVFLGVTCTAFTIWLAFTSVWPLLVVYGIWYAFDRNTPFQGGRHIKLFRDARVWRHFRDYFPINLVKTHELDPTKNYILACHPHGILCISHFANFATEATGFSALFPNILPHLMVLPGGFRFPIFREYFSTTGACSCEKPSLEYILSQKGEGNAACIIVGGAIESLEAKSGNFNLNLINKKGFIKSAIRTGSSLVPVYSFGENDLYSQAVSPRARRLQKWFTDKMGFTVPLAYGRGIFNYNFGIYPYRKPVTTVVGEPIPVIQNPNPTPEEVNKLHAVYLDSLYTLFEMHKWNYNIPKEIHLHFI